MRVKKMVRRLGAVAVVATLALGLAACGSEEGGSQTDSKESTAELKELSAEEFYPTVTGALVDAETFVMESTSTTNGEATSVKGVVRYGDDSVALRATTEGVEKMEMIILDENLYVSAPSLDPEGKWMRVDLSEDGLFGMLGKSMDPQVLFKAMESPKELKLIGEEEVDGVATNHYRIVMDPKQYMDALDLPAEMAELLPKEISTDMWVDADNRPRKFSQSTTTPELAGNPATTTEVEGFYKDFGSEVEITEPPAEEIIDAPAFPGAA